MNELKAELSKEWNKPKKKNLYKDRHGNIFDIRAPRNYKKIKGLQKQINELKA